MTVWVLLIAMFSSDKELEINTEVYKTEVACLKAANEKLKASQKLGDKYRLELDCSLRGVR